MINIGFLYPGSTQTGHNHSIHRLFNLYLIPVLVLSFLSGCQSGDQVSNRENPENLPPQWTATPHPNQQSQTATPSTESTAAGPLATETPEPPERSGSFMQPPAAAESGFAWESAVDGKTMLFIPEGGFWQGAMNEYKAAEPDERPRRRITLSAFWIGQSEVTNSEYTSCVEAQACSLPVYSASASHSDYFENEVYGSYPVLGVTWYQARDYCAWVGGRLPTEAEWEKAARGRDGRRYPWEWVGSVYTGAGEIRLNFCDQTCLQAYGNDSFDDGFPETAPVGSFPAGASTYGLYDMAGNVWEWVSDWYDSDYYESGPEANPGGPSTGFERVIKGGSWLDTTYEGVPLVFRSSNRASRRPASAYNDLGFRCVIPASAE